MDGAGDAAPEGRRSATPCLGVDGAARAVGFCAEAFSARERMRLDAPGGEVGDALVMLADPWPGGAPEASCGESASVGVRICVPDAHAVLARAPAAGAAAIRPVEAHLHGDRGGMLRDPLCHHGHVAARVEGAERRMAARFGAG